MVKQAIEERRRHFRAKRVLSIQYKLSQARRKKTGRQWILSTTEDMSSGGLSFYTDREYCLGDILDLHVIMSGVLDVYKGCAQVVRMERTKSGVCFLAAVSFVDQGLLEKRPRRCRVVQKSRVKTRF